MRVSSQSTAPVDWGSSAVQMGGVCRVPSGNVMVHPTVWITLTNCHTTQSAQLQASLLCDSSRLMDIAESSLPYGMGTNTCSNLYYDSLPSFIKPYGLVSFAFS